MTSAGGGVPESFPRFGRRELRRRERSHPSVWHACLAGGGGGGAGGGGLEERALRLQEAADARGGHREVRGAGGGFFGYVHPVPLKLERCVGGWMVW